VDWAHPSGEVLREMDIDASTLLGTVRGKLPREAKQLLSAAQHDFFYRLAPWLASEECGSGLREANDALMREPPAQFARIARKHGLSQEAFSHFTDSTEKPQKLPWGSRASDLSLEDSLEVMLEKVQAAIRGIPAALEELAGGSNVSEMNASFLSQVNPQLASFLERLMPRMAARFTRGVEVGAPEAQPNSPEVDADAWQGPPQVPLLHDATTSSMRRHLLELVREPLLRGAQRLQGLVAPEERAAAAQVETTTTARPEASPSPGAPAKPSESA
jgi:hypothetical protein